MLGRYGEALEAYDRALAYKPDIKYARGQRLFAKMRLGLERVAGGNLTSIGRSKRWQSSCKAIHPFELVFVRGGPAGIYAAVR